MKKSMIIQTLMRLPVSFCRRFCRAANATNLEICSFSCSFSNVLNLSASTAFGARRCTVVWQYRHKLATVQKFTCERLWLSPFAELPRRRLREGCHASDTWHESLLG